MALGEAAIPLILLASYQQSHLLSVAIERMTGQAVEIPEGQRGNVDAIQEAWRQWGKSRGYI